MKVIIADSIEKALEAIALEVNLEPKDTSKLGKIRLPELAKTRQYKPRRFTLKRAV